MTLLLEPSAVIFLIALIFFTSLGFIYLLWVHSGKSQCTRYWMWSVFCTAVGYLLIVSRPYIPDFLSIGLANGILVLGSLLLLKGHHAYLALEFNRYWFGAATALIAVFHYFVLFEPDINTRIILMSCWTSAIYFAIGWAYASEIKEDSWSSTIVVCLIYSVAFIVFSVRVVNHIVFPTDGLFEKTSLTQWEFIFLVWTQCIQLFAFYLLMINDRNRTVKRLIEYDPETGLLNAVTFQHRASQRFFNSIGRSRYCSVIIIKCNLSHLGSEVGHSRTNLVNRRIAEIIREVFPADLIGREDINGFSIYVERIEQLPLEKQAQSLRRKIEAHLRDCHLWTLVNLNVGMATNLQGKDFEQIFRCAELAAQWAKKKQLNEVVHFETIAEEKLAVNELGV